MAAELLTRYFSNDLAKQLFPSGNFLSYAKNDDAYVNNNSVELPNSGTLPAVTVNRSSFPATATQRTDTAGQYILAEFSTAPTNFQFSEGLMIAYNKRADLLEQHVKMINQKGEETALYNWAATGITVVPTTGSARATSSPSATGTRKALTAADVIKAINVLNQQDVPVEGRKIIVPADMYGDMLAIDNFVRADSFGTPNIPTGLIGRVYGCDVFMRSSVTVYTGTTIKAQGAAGAAADNQGAIVWHPDFVRRAKGASKVLLRMDDPLYYGDVLSAVARFGAVRARLDNKGVVAIVEAA